MQISLIAFDDFTDIDLFLLWDLMNRVDRPNWEVKILGDQRTHRSTTGLEVTTDGMVEEARSADIVLFGSGLGSRAKVKDGAYLSRLAVDPSRQLIGSQCSGALILAKLGLLGDGPATTHPYAKAELSGLGVHVVDAPLVSLGNVATAGGCLSGVYLAAWALEKALGAGAWRRYIPAVFPAGEQEEFDKRVARALETGSSFAPTAA